MAGKVIDLEKIRREREGELIRRLSYYGDIEKLDQVITRAVWRKKQREIARYGRCIN